MPKISIIIPVYNVEPYLEKCLDSICNQTLRDIEIICVNDCSPDNSLEILKKYAKDDNRIKIIDFKENKGVAIARNEGIKLAKGEYIGFVDSDDWIDLDFYEKLYKKAKETNADIVNTKTKVIQDENILSLKYFGYCAGIYKNSFLEQEKILFEEGCICGEDQVFIVKSDILSSKKVSLEYPYYYYRQRKGSASFNKEKNALQFQSDLKAFDVVYTFISNKLCEENAKKIEKLNEYLRFHANYIFRLNEQQTETYIKFLYNYFNILDKNKVLDNDNKMLYKALTNQSSKDVLKILTTLNKKAFFQQLRNNIRCA